jgi:hypothetical protein
MWIPLLVLVYAYAGALSWLAWRRWPPLATPLGTALGALGFGLLVLATNLSSPRIGLTSISVFLLLPAVLVIIPFAIRAAETATDTVRRAAMGLDRMKPVRTYDLAEKAAAERRDDEAVRLYREVYLAKDPADPVPRLRIADLLLRGGRRAEAATELRAAVPLIEDIDQALVTAFRVADLDPAGSAAWLASLRPRVADPRKRELLEARIRKAGGA